MRQRRSQGRATRAGTQGHRVKAFVKVSAKVLFFLAEPHVGRQLNKNTFIIFFK